MKPILLRVFLLIMLFGFNACDDLSSAEEVDQWKKDFSGRFETAIDDLRGTDDLTALQEVYVDHVCECYSKLQFDHTREEIARLAEQNIEEGKADMAALSTVLMKGYEMELVKFCIEVESMNELLAPSIEEKDELENRVEQQCGGVKKQKLQESKAALQEYSERMEEAGITVQ